MAKVAESAQVSTETEDTSSNSAGTDEQRLYLRLEKENEIRTRLAEFARELALVGKSRETH